ncbi:hypothetical protein P3T37_000892 [Kitasatospora sp. MAA4]|uniref:hypothetical protein n=1 Tax=Kitasatospora sp. MAA4 TaxID=3035093 RepID=UPI0024740B25|nr:hypothetical protein [Kitasatospora sp. MAA4]MDH6131523.1 hypothetical protein [Kitasatospora sp. MAA4]
MASSDDQELSTALKNAESPAWSVRAAAGRQLAVSDRIDEAADVLHRLLLEAQDSAVTSETAAALLARKDTTGLRYVLLARSCAAATWTADEIQAALDCDPDWLTAEGADRLIKQLRELAMDSDADVRDEAQRILARLRPREEWARDPGRDAI